MYGGKKVSNVNDARYDMFRLGIHAEESLPPNKDSLVKHILRANYQACIFRRCLEQMPEFPPQMEWDGSWKKLTVKGLFKLTGAASHQLQMTFWNLPTAAARKVVADMSQT